MTVLHPAAALVQELLDATMVPDPDTAATFMAPGATITFTGGVQFSRPHDIAAYNGSRYKWVKKKYGSYDVAAGTEGTVVYSLGTLYGEWPDGTPFEDTRYIDRFVIRDGKITRWDVWNDSAERILSRQGQMAPQTR